MAKGITDHAIFEVCLFRLATGAMARIITSYALNELTQAMVNDWLTASP